MLRTRATAPTSAAISARCMAPTCGTTLYLNGALVLGLNQYDTRRILNTGGVVDNASGSFDGWQYGAKVEAGYPVPYGQLHARSHRCALLHASLPGWLHGVECARSSALDQLQQYRFVPHRSGRTCALRAADREDVLVARASEPSGCTSSATPRRSRPHGSPPAAAPSPRTAFSRAATRRALSFGAWFASRMAGSAC